MTDEAIFTLVATLAVTAVMAVPAYLATRIKSGEARFDEHGNVVDDE